jgi:hypothetical protein
MTPTFLNPPKNYTPAAFYEFVASLKWTGWRPKFLTLHNTASPTLAEYLNQTEAQREQRLVNIDAIYKNVDHWHAGPHLFIDPYEDGIWNASDLGVYGVSVSCWNEITMGVEMVGNYATEAEQAQVKDPPPVDDWTSAAANIVRDNAIAALAILHDALGLRPDGFVLGQSGLHFHRMCKADAHQCPGGQVDRDDIVARVLASMASAEPVG